MIAFILAGIVVGLTFGAALFVAMANGMSDNPTLPGFPVWRVFLYGFIIAALIAGSHYVKLNW